MPDNLISRSSSATILRMTDDQLIQRIQETAILKGQFTLRSGRTSRYYVDKYLFETQPDILQALAERLAAHVPPDTQRLAAAELGGIPLVTATALVTGLPMVLIRNQKKDYGTAKRFEGKLEAGERVVVLEDIVTSGGQSVEAANALRDAGAEVVRIIAVVDRQEGGREAIEQAGYPMVSLLTKADLGIDES